MGGDFNVSSWGLLYQEWMQTEGIIELVDPCVPTFTSGSALDKLLFVPGGYIPSTLLPTRGSAEQDKGMASEDHHFPASVLHYDHISDHYPVLLSIPCDREEKIKDNEEVAEL